MVRVTEAIFTGGVLKPLSDLQLEEEQRVRLIVEPIEQAQPRDRTLAFERLRAGIAAMGFYLRSPLPSRDELHDRR